MLGVTRGLTKQHFYFGIYSNTSVLYIVESNELCLYLPLNIISVSLSNCRTSNHKHRELFMTVKNVRNLFFLSSAEALTRMLFGSLESQISGLF